jgi:hypothetical protein
MDDEDEGNRRQHETQTAQLQLINHLLKTSMTDEPPEPLIISLTSDDSNVADLLSAPAAPEQDQQTATFGDDAFALTATLPTQIQPGTDQADVMEANNTTNTTEEDTDSPPPAEQPPQAPPQQRQRVHIRQRIRTRAGATPPAAGTGGHTIPLRFSDRLRLNLGNGNVVTVPLQRQDTNGSDGIATATGTHGNVNVRVVQMKPLTPQPLPDAAAAESFHDDDDDPALVRFKCDICYDFFRSPVPVGCGGCAARFCRECLQRVFIDENARRRPHKCPVCRVEYSHMVPDNDMRAEMETAGPTLPCRYDGCPERELRLTMVGEHEKVCEHAPVRCRYAAYGCAWTGKRGAVQTHETNECRVSPIGPFVEQYRQMKADHGARIDVVMQQASIAARMHGSIRQSLALDHAKSTADVFQLLHFIQCLTCCTPLVYFAKEKWHSYLRSDETRATVVNFLVFMPSVILALTIGAQGLSNFCFAVDKLIVLATAVLREETNFTLAFERAVKTLLTPQIERLMQDALIGSCTAVFAGLIVAMSFLDEKSGTSWRGIKIRHLGTPPVVGDLLGVLVFAMFMCIMEFHNAGFRSLIIWTLVLFCSTVFPSVVLTLSHYVAHKEPPTPTNILSLARSFEPFMFGLRYSFLEAFFGMSACLDAIVILGVLPPSINNKFLKDCFVGQLPDFVCVSFVGFKASMLAMEFMQSTDENPVLELLNSFIGTLNATVALLLLNALVLGLLKLGIKVGTRIASTSQTLLRPEGFKKDYNVIGILAFGAWCLALFAMTQM